MFIKSTGVKNLLVLNSIKQELRKGQELPIRDDEYWNNDVQVALKMGWITASGVPVKKMDSGEEVPVIEEQVIECENTHHRSIALNQHEMGIRPGQRFNLKESDLDTPAIKNAISREMIKVISSVSHKSFANETTVDISPSKKLFENEDDDRFGDVVDVGLETNEELSTPTIVEDTKGVKWNAKEEVVSVSMTNVITDDNPAPVDPNKDDPKGRSVVVDPNKARFLKYNRDENITFIDQDGEADRIIKHPTMDVQAKKQAIADVRETNETDVVIDDEDEIRRKAHPILGKQDNNPKDVDFLDDLDDLEVRVAQHPVLGKKDIETIE